MPPRSRLSELFAFYGSRPVRPVSPGYLGRGGVRFPFSPLEAYRLAALVSCA